jgi:hypothetical protein
MMANYTVNFAKHATLTPSTVDTITVNQPASFFLVTNRATSGGPIYFTLGDTLDKTAQPTVGGDDTFGIGLGVTVQIPFDGSPSYIRLISANAQDYSVMVI